MDAKSTEVIVIGAGLSGLLVARELLREGATVRVVERGEVGAEASWAGGGILSPIYPWRYLPAVNLLADAGRRSYARLCQELKRDTGIDPQWVLSGLLILDTHYCMGPGLASEASRADESDVYAIDTGDMSRWLASSTQPTRRLSERDVAQLEPNLGEPHFLSEHPPGSNALLLPEVGQVRNPRLVHALHADVVRRGGIIETNQEVRQLMIDGDRVKGVETIETTWLANKVVVATGAWSSQFLQQMAIFRELGLSTKSTPRSQCDRGRLLSSPIRPVKGQMLLYRVAPDLIRSIVVCSGHYLVPRRDGHLLVGSTMEETGFDKSTTRHARAVLERVAHRLVPKLAELEPVGQWAGLRPGTADGVPYIGPIAQVKGLYINAGHFRNGVVMGPAAATLAVDHVLGRPPSIAPEPYLP